MSDHWNAISAVGTAVGAAATVGAAGFAYWAVNVARDGVAAALATVKEAAAARRAELFLQLSGEYASEEMHESLVLLAWRKRSSPSSEAMRSGYVEEVRRSLATGEVADWDKARRKVSRFFLRAADLARAGLLDRLELARLVRRSGLELYLTTVIPLDEAHTEAVFGSGRDSDQSSRTFWVEFGRKELRLSASDITGGST